MKLIQNTLIGLCLILLAFIIGYSHFVIEPKLDEANKAARECSVPLTSAKGLFLCKEKYDSTGVSVIEETCFKWDGVAPQEEGIYMLKVK